MLQTSPWSSQYDQQQQQQQLKSDFRPHQHICRFSDLPVMSSSASPCDSSELPLQVLSRAATMVEKSPVDRRDSRSPPTSDVSSHTAPAPSGCERRPSFKERHPKFRKPTTPDYFVAAAAAAVASGKFHRQTSFGSASDASATSSMQVDSSSSSSPPPRPLHRPFAIVPPASTAAAIYTSYREVQVDEDEAVDVEDVEDEEQEAPLDMSIKKPRSDSPPAPPPYRFTRIRSCPQTAESGQPKLLLSTPPPPYACHSEALPPPPSYEASTQLGMRINQCAKEGEVDPRPIREITIITDSSADPLLDEHFRRSLGANYQSLFKKTAAPSPPLPLRLPSAKLSNKVDPVKALKEDMKMDGLTVEDHFAKALGDTWLKLQAKQEDSKPTSSGSNHGGSATTSGSGGSQAQVVA